MNGGRRGWRREGFGGAKIGRSRPMHFMLAPQCAVSSIVALAGADQARVCCGRFSRLIPHTLDRHKLVLKKNATLSGSVLEHDFLI